jgi:hypothetical protein
VGRTAYLPSPEKNRRQKARALKKTEATFEIARTFPFPGGSKNKPATIDAPFATSESTAVFFKGRFCLFPALRINLQSGIRLFQGRISYSL